MPVYYATLVLSVLLAMAAMFYPEVYSVKLNKSGKLVVFQTRKMLLFLAFMPMLLVSALRKYVGVDYSNYAWIFKAINTTNEKTHVEPLFKFLNQLVYFYADHVELLFALASLLITFFFARGIIENSANIPYSIFLFISLGYFFYSMNSVRHFMALSLYFFAYKYMKKQRFWPFLVCVLVASGFHKVALIAIPLYFLFTRRFKMSYYVIIAIFMAICAVFNKQILNLIFSFVYASYRNSAYNVYTFSAFNILLSALCALLAVIYYKPLMKRDPSNVIFVNSAIFSFLFYLFCFWIPTPSRIGQYGTILYVLFLPEVLKCEPDKKIRRFYLIFFSVLALLFMTMMLLKSNDPTLRLLPYQTIFD